MVLALVIGGVAAAIATASGVASGLMIFLVKKNPKLAKKTRAIQTLGCFEFSRYYMNAALNGLDLTDFLVAESLNESDVITEFYSQTNGTSHGWVAFRTEGGTTYWLHLVGNPEKLMIRVEKTNWLPVGYKVCKLREGMPFGVLKYHVNGVIKNWGHYTLGLRDCRHFARNVHKFLKTYC